MTRFDLTDEEAAVLAETLRSDLSDLRMEIADTELQTFRDQLKHKEDVIKHLIGRLESTGALAP